MFETLFKQPEVLFRYCQGPLLEAREKFLRECAENGYSQSMLQKIAWIQLSLAHSLDLNHGKVTDRDIEWAIDNRKRFRNYSSQNSDGSRQLFIHVATEWVRSLGYFEPSREIENPFASQIAAFAHYLYEERGLSQITISTRCERLKWFFDSLQPHQDTLRKVSVIDVDAFIEKMGAKGWKRSSLSCLASSLRSFFRYAEGQGWCAPSIAAVITSPRLYAREGIPEGPSWEDVQRLLDSTSGNRPADIRDHAILMLLAVYGLRRGEVAELQLTDIDWVGEKIMVFRPKPRRTQCYPLVPPVGEAIVHYLREVRPRGAHQSLFLTMAAPILSRAANTDPI